MKDIMVEVQLDGALCPKRCPCFLSSEEERLAGYGKYNLLAIREYFKSLGYSVGPYVRVL